MLGSSLWGPDVWAGQHSPEGLPARGTAPAPGPHLHQCSPAWVPYTPLVFGLPGRMYSCVINFSWGLSVQNGRFWLGDQLRGRHLRAMQALVLVLLRCCYRLSFLKLCLTEDKPCRHSVGFPQVTWPVCDGREFRLAKHCTTCLSRESREDRTLCRLVPPLPPAPSHGC